MLCWFNGASNGSELRDGARPHQVRPVSSLDAGQAAASRSGAGSMACPSSPLIASISAFTWRNRSAARVATARAWPAVTNIAQIRKAISILTRLWRLRAER